MIEQTSGKKYSQFINLLIFIFPIVINSVKVVGDIVLFILAIIGIFIAISQKLSPFTIKEVKVFSYLTTGYFLALCLSVIFSGKFIELAHYIPRDFHFLFAPFIALAFYKAEINLNYLLSGIKAGLIVLGIIIIYQLLLGVPIRPSGVMNANVFTSLTISMFLVVLVFLQQESFNHKMFTLLSLFSGFLVIAVSGNPGNWILFLLLLVSYLCFLYKKQIKSNKILTIIVMLIIASVLATGSLNQHINDRLYNAYEQTSNWSPGAVLNSSVSHRLEMYRIAIDNVDDVPFFGHGYRTSNQVISKIASNDIEKFISLYTHLHNAYLTSFYNGGIVLLGALLLLIFVPFRIFIKAMSQNWYEPVFVVGALLTVSFASHGIFNVLFGDVFMNAFYVFYLAIFLHLTAKSTKAS